MLNPPITGNDELDSWLYQISTNGASEGSDTLTTLPSSGEPVGYPYQFIHIKYGDDPVGGGFSNTPTNKMYWGVYNSTSSTESTNPADYTWFKSSSGFSTNIFLYYLILGNRNIKFTLATSQPSYKWSVDAGLAIDLDNIVPATTVSTNEILNDAITAIKIAAGEVTAAKTAIAAIDPSTGNLTANSVTSAQIVGGTIVADNIAVGTITADRMNVSNLAAISANLGTITAGDISGTNLTIGSSPNISGTTMTGSGAKINSTGTFALGDSNRNIVNNGTDIYLNGFTSFTKTSGAVTSSTSHAGIASLTEVTTLLSSIVLKKGKMFVAANGTVGVTHKGAGARMIRVTSGIRIVDTTTPATVYAVSGFSEQTCFAPAGSNTYPIRFTANTSFFTEDLIPYIGTDVNIELYTNFEIFELGLPPPTDITYVYNQAECFCTEFLV